MNFSRPAALVNLAFIITVGFLTLYPTGMLICGSLSSEFGTCGNFTFAKYVTAYSDPRVAGAVANTLVFAVGTATLATLLAMLVAWVTVRTNTPLRGTFEILAIAPNLLPAILVSVAWTLLLSPDNGMINALIRNTLGLTSPPFNIYTMPGMIFVEAMVTFPLAVLIIAGALKSMDPAMEEAARVAGAGNLRIALGVTFALIWPAILAAWLLNFVRAAESFETPGILAIPARIEVVTTLIRKLTQVIFPPDHGLAAALGAILVAVTVITVYGYRTMTKRVERFVTVTGRGFRPSIIDLGRMKWATAAFSVILLGLTLLLPISVLFIASLEPYIHVPTWETIGLLSFSNYIKLFTDTRSLRVMYNSIFLAAAGATLAMILSSAISYITVKTKGFGRGLLETLSFLPFSFPGIVLAVGFLWAYIRTPLYFTIWILLIAYITRFIPFGIRATSSTIVQIHNDLEDASKLCGASFLRTFREIILPMLKPGFLAGWILLAGIFIREVSTSILLVSPGNEVIGVYIFTLYEDGRSHVLSALGIIVTIISVALIAGVGRLARLGEVARTSEPAIRGRT